MDGEIAAQLRHITKRFGTTLANDDASLTVRRGEILALFGENGSGKTTLMNILSGLYLPDAGEIWVDGKQTAFRSPRDAFRQGIGMIHQSFRLVDVFTAAENIVLGTKQGPRPRRAVRERVMELSRRYGFSIDTEKRVYDMSAPERQTVEIVKALYRGADTLILDEPTSLLTPQDAARLFDLLRAMRAEGKSIVLITHKLAEVMALADRVTVLRRGSTVATVRAADVDAAELAELMVGRAVQADIPRTPPAPSAPRLTVRGLTCLDRDRVRRVDGVSFTAMRGEVLGIAGVTGSGQRELLSAIAGLQPAAEGEVLYHLDDGWTAALANRTPAQIQAAGAHIGFIPENRLGVGLAGGLGMTGNFLLRSWRDAPGVLVDPRPAAAQAAAVRDRLGVDTPDLDYPVRRLSGGNFQKVLVGREIARNPDLLLAAYAVRGLDVHASRVIYDLLNEQKARGASIVFVGEDLDVLLGFCDRILVLCGGRCSGIVDARTTTKHTLGMMMSRQGEGGMS